jgi:antitoxin component YwqK of YwqJK toxin-antitoxin module
VNARSARTPLAALLLVALPACTHEEERTLHYGNGQAWSEIHLRAGVPHGTWRTWYENGHAKSQGSYVDGLRDGLWTHWWENGQKQGEGRFVLGRQDGEWSYWFASGQPASHGTFEQGVLEGEWTDYFGELDASGNPLVRSHVTFHHGLQDLVSRSYWPTGKLEHEWTYMNGVLDGPWREFRADGSEFVLGEYDNGKKTGLWMVYRLDGSVDETRSGEYDGEKIVRRWQAQ